MSNSHKIFWGDSHHNTYQHSRQNPPLDEVLSYARTHLDFYTGAYYTSIFEEFGLLDKASVQVSSGPAVGHAYEASGANADGWHGVRVEDMKTPEVLRAEWAEFQQVTRAQNTPGEFVAFPGYEWQGNARWGDHNVVLREEGTEICQARTLPDLYAALRRIDAIAIPHHTAYMPGMRAPHWKACDTSISPYSEIFSVHGCSETDEERPGLRRNPHMGPGTADGTYRAALLRGLRLGAICSTDNWTNMPGHWGHGLMAVLAPELTREALWEAFRARRVYGVTGDRIELDFTCNDAPMGSILPYTKARQLRVHAVACDEIDKIEILRDERVIHTHNHLQRTADSEARCRLRVEVGWGSLEGELPMAEMPWDVKLHLSQGSFTDWSPCWTTRGQSASLTSQDSCSLQFLSQQGTSKVANQNATVVEFAAEPGTALTLRANGQELRATVKELLAGSQLLWYPEETAEMVRTLTGVELAPGARQDMLYHMSPKVKVHRAIPESAYTACVELEDVATSGDGAFYRVRVEQRNGQRAWSSPIWIEPSA
ncbi:MAG: DUF3604 domain-containing protein [Lentisphaeria bacterium]|nr:DUF3604 domain-containing protein [Lentisphaeria bacterium]